MLLIRPATPQDLTPVLEHLRVAKLVLAGVEEHLEHFWIATNNETIIATAGLEVYGQQALLRSVAVNAAYQHQGIGKKIIATILEYAKNLEIEQVFLLTETAELYFQNLGFRQTTRDTVTESMLSSVEFLGACSDSAVLMTRALLKIRAAQPSDVTRVTEIYNQGIADRIATFETEPRNSTDILGWFDPKYPFLVAERNNVVQGFIRASSYRSRECYAGIAEYSVYVARDLQGQRIGDALLTAFLPALTAAGFWKVLSRIFPENTASRKLCARHHFREVGIYQKHAMLDGIWRDCVIVEKILE